MRMRPKPMPCGLLVSERVGKLGRLYREIGGAERKASTGDILGVTEDRESQAQITSEIKA